MKNNPLIETTACKWTVLEEEQLSEGKIVKPMKIGGIASRGNVANENRRYYKTSLFERESNRLANDVGNGRMVGELDHPDDGKSRLSKNAMKFTKLFMDGDYLKFEAEVLDTVAGKDLKANLKGGVAVDISTRGFGSTKEEKINGSKVNVIQDDFELTAIDAVSGHSNLEAEIQYFKEKAETNPKGGGREMKLEELRTKYPELVAAIVEETETRVRKEVTDDLTTKFETKVIDEIAKTRDEMTDEITETVKTELMPEHEENQVKLAEIADIVGKLVEGNENKTSDEKDEQITALQTSLAESNKKIDKFGTELKEASEKIAQADVKDYLDEALKNEPFKVMLKERLFLCVSREEVDEQLPKERDYVNKILNDSKIPKGKGQVIDEDANDTQTQEQLDEAKRKQRRLAGIQEKADS